MTVAQSFLVSSLVKACIRSDCHAVFSSFFVNQTVLRDGISFFMSWESVARFDAKHYPMFNSIGMASSGDNNSNPAQRSTFHVFPPGGSLGWLRTIEQAPPHWGRVSGSRKVHGYRRSRVLIQCVFLGGFLHSIPTHEPSAKKTHRHI